MILNPDFREFFQLLNKNKVRYLVIGGFAVAFHGYPRYTKDVDIWLLLQRDNAEKVIRTLVDFGFESLGLEASDFLEADTIIQLGHPPYRIDLILSPPGIDFEACYPARIVEEIDGVRIPFIDLENLKKNKRAAGRAQDLADLENLE
jgi:predicted nucleotidyltransferase